MFCGLIGAIVSCARLSRLGPEPHDTELQRDELVRDAQQLLALVAALEQLPKRLRRVLWP
jgi:DNA-directed RNA polymerase specialized sigma24 family protein